ncbi:MAG TPA: SUMF1/EgtB/PvdO family nonheme iron enzyme [Bacteroidales bacterium]|nr:SUMF1/EgtB/PvdO family nonheme iron enzyme [Bacteroidales bacterium]
MHILKNPITVLLNIILLSASFCCYSQDLINIGISNKSGLNVENFLFSDSSTITLPSVRPLYSFYLGNKLYSSEVNNIEKKDKQYSQTFGNNLRVTFTPADSLVSGWEGRVVFENRGSDTVTVSNVVPFGEDKNSVFITGDGLNNLTQASLFRPGFAPVSVILPDNAWETGYSSFNTGNDLSVCAIARRTATEGGIIQQYKTILPPKAKVSYIFHIDFFKGEWQNGLRKIFRDRYLYDMKSFNDSLYKRADQVWMKECYLSILQAVWDKNFYDRIAGKFNYGDVIRKGLELFGNIDIYGIWPSWPQYGLDERNQWDLYSSMPGGTEQLRNFIRMSHQYNTRFFLAYTPWNKNLKKGDQIKGIENLIIETEADGLLLDTRDSSCFELQKVIDNDRKGVVVCSELMPCPKYMERFISGRVGGDIINSPELNLNKLMRPDFSVFRVCNVGDDVLHREIAVSFFNGYGTELNMLNPGGRDKQYENDLGFLARTTFILRQNNDAFLDQDWTPMIETTHDSVFVNRWISGEKTVYTILNMRSDGVNGYLFKSGIDSGKHYVSLWNHENVSPTPVRDTALISVSMEGWQRSFSGTRREGSVDCIAELPELIRSKLTDDSLKITVDCAGSIRIWKGDPSYHTESREFIVPKDTTVCIKDIFGSYEGKIVLQLVENKRLKDESIHIVKYGTPWIISRVVPTKRSEDIPEGMVLVPGAEIVMNITASENLISYPSINGDTIKVDSFLIDKYPVTNEQYYEFMVNSGYWPADTSGYLSNWQSGMFRQGQEKYPVVNLSYEDMKAYSEWAGKRLPTQAEWQLAAQGTDGRKWPWGNEFHATYCNNSFNRPTPVDAFSKGQSIYGVFDLVGNVWQMTNDMYFNGSNYFMIIRGGSYYRPDFGPWNIQGGPQPLDRTQMLLLSSPGFDRSPAVGFRCVRDVDVKHFNNK